MQSTNLNNTLANQNYKSKGATGPIVAASQRFLKKYLNEPQEIITLKQKETNTNSSDKRKSEAVEGSEEDIIRKLSEATPKSKLRKTYYKEDNRPLKNFKIKKIIKI